MAGERSFCSSCFILLFHILCTIVAVAALGIGVYVYWNSAVYSRGIQNCAMPLIAVGVLVTSIHTCGCWTIHRCDNRCFSYILIVLIFLIAAVLVILAGLTYFTKNETLDVLSKSIETKFKSAHDGNPTDMDFVNTFQIYGECCGVDGPSFWKYPGDLSLPKSCCKEQNSAPLVFCEFTEAYQDGCKEKAMSIFSTFIYTITIAIISLAVFEIISGFVTFHQMNQRREQRIYRRTILYRPGVMSV